jgi:hypothetical protein
LVEDEPEPAVDIKRRRKDAIFWWKVEGEEGYSAVKVEVRKARSAMTLTNATYVTSMT